MMVYARLAGGREGIEEEGGGEMRREEAEERRIFLLRPEGEQAPWETRWSKGQPRTQRHPQIVKRTNH